MRRNAIIASVVALGLVVVVGAVVVFTRSSLSGSENTCFYCSYQNQSKLGEICSPSPLGAYSKYAVSTDSNVCAPAGKYVFACFVSCFYILLMQTFI